jgi:RNA polymerase sigma-70 factor (ECF subfamily)
MRHRNWPGKALAATDSELISAFQCSSDPSLLDDLVRRHIGRVRAIIYPMVLDDAVADDLTQDTFVRAVRGLRSFRQDSEFSTWLYAIAMNCVRTFLARRPRPVAPIDVNMELTTNERPEKVAIGQELSEAIRRSIEQLSPKLRSAVVLISLNGLNATQAAAVEGCTVATMHSRLHEAREQLKRLLKGHLS